MRAMAAPTLREELTGRRFGLVLSAGYFGFYGHAGFLAGLHDAGLTPSAYSGSSAGGLIGALAAAGVPSERIAQLLRELKRETFWDPAPLATLRGALRGGHHLTGLLTGERFRELVANALPVQRIEECPTPLRIVATNLSRHAMEEFSRGLIAPRVVATCAYPGLFRAAHVDGQLYWDGGMVDKAPVLSLANLAKELRLDALLVHYLPTAERDVPHGLWAYAHGLDAGMAIARREHFLLQLEVTKARGLPVHVVVSHLPPVSPRQLERGVEALEAARASVGAALQIPPQPFA
jgi:NTE family protein